MNLLDYLFYFCHFHSAASFKTAPKVLCVVHHPHSVKIACQRSINWRTMWEQTSAVEETAARSPPLFLLSISNLFVLYLSMCLNLHPLFFFLTWITTQANMAQHGPHAFCHLQLP